MEFVLPTQLKVIVERIASRGGRAYLVGGAVIDMLKGLPVKDWDIEVFGIGYDQLYMMFSDFSPSLVGKSFGILKLNVHGLDVDINVPRRDNKIGVGHKGFNCQMDPNMSVKEAARRRDFTINTMAVNLHTGELENPFGGLEDLQQGILRVTDPKLFVQDPLRVLRAMQLLARKAKTCDPASMKLMQGMVHHFDELPKERVFEEFKKLFLKAKKPSVGLRFLDESGWIQHFPELVAMQGCEQHPVWHPEGDVWTHAMQAADAAAQVRAFVPSEKRLGFVLGVFLHDIGKPATTITKEMIQNGHPRVKELATKNRKKPEDLLLTAYGHDIAGVAPAVSFMKRITNERKITALVKSVVEFHMQPWYLYDGGAGKAAYKRLHRKFSNACGGDLNLLGMVCQCDACATGFGRSLEGGKPNWEHKSSEMLFEYAEEFAGNNTVQPKVMGRDLIKAGLKPGPHFRKLLDRALEIQDRDETLSKEEIIAELLSE